MEGEKYSEDALNCFRDTGRKRCACVSVCIKVCLCVCVYVREYEVEEEEGGGWRLSNVISARLSQI